MVAIWKETTVRRGKLWRKKKSYMVYFKKYRLCYWIISTNYGNYRTD